MNLTGPNMTESTRETKNVITMDDSFLATAYLRKSSQSHKRIMGILVDDDYQEWAKKQRKRIASSDD